ncbi:MAG: amino acid adenylation domain-containing protein [Gammaproteobacteria bacterium]|nr:amino acid adenylation domain-containing protein [Gammaproteobacteria bacterium]
MSIDSLNAPLPDGVLAIHPLAPEQVGLWYLQQLAPSCGAYHLLFSVDVTVGLDGWPSALPQLLDALLTDYPVLRTALPETPEGPQQWVHQHVTPDVQIVNASGWSDERLREQARTDSRVPFDLGCPPLWRVHLYQRTDSRWLAVVVVHHVLLDFWSLGLLLQEVAGRLGIAERSTQPLEGSGYGQYAHAQQIRQTDPALRDRDLKYWRDQLKGAPPVHSLPFDAPRPALQEYDGHTLPFVFDATVSESIRRVAREESATPFMVLLAAYSVLLRQFSGDDDLVIATPVAGRTERSQRMQLGQYVNTVALRVQLDDSISFSNLLQQVRDVVVGALRHQDFPFSSLVEELAPRRDPSYAPIAQLGFSWERLPLLAEFEHFFLADPPLLERHTAGLVLRPFAVPQQEGQLDLMLEMGGEREGAFVGVFKYQHRLLRPDTIAEMARYFIGLTEQLVAAPQCPLGQIRPDNPVELARWLAMGRGPRCDWQQGSVSTDIFECVTRAPNAPAVRDATRQLDYATLWRRAGQIAGVLRSAGVIPDAHVGLMLERGVDLVAGILGIWRAGAAYVPLDPSFPAERLAYIASDAQLSALITESDLQPLWPDGLSTICVDMALPDQAPHAPLVSKVAYVLYTSGSTGQPKGVRVGHGSVRNFLLGMQTLLQWDAHTRLLAVTTPAFDISVLELLLPLLAGGEVIVADNASLRDGAKLADRLASDTITAMQATPATWKMLIDAGWQGCKTLTALCGGDTLSPQLAQQLHARTTALWNLYGPTETTVWSTAVRLVPDAPIHVGRAIANTQLYVLDSQGYPVPPGVIGELWIGGDGLALDYWKKPELTAERFRVLDTLPQAGRVYRTGDRVRWTADGRLEHHGRLDFQVKLRGYRIELGEIESVLRQHHAVRDTVVVVREDRPSDPRLVAYLVAANEATVLDELRDALRAELPAYMLPSAFVFLEHLPQTPNCKIDRKALPAPEVSLPDSDYVAPRDELEIQLAGLFSDLLSVSRVGIEDNFFDLGGHSLLAVQLVAGIKRLFDVELSVAELIQHATVAALASRLRRGGDARPGMLLTLRARRDVQPLWLFHPIGGNVFCYLELCQHLASERPVLAIQSPGLINAGEAEVTIEAMAGRYLEVLREKQPQGPYLLGGWCFGGIIAFEVARRLRDSGEMVTGITLIDTRAPVPANVPSDADDATLLSWFARDLATPYGKSLRITADILRALPNESMLEYVLNEAKAIDVLPRDADIDQFSRYFEVYIANGIALQLYFPPAESLPVLLVRAVDEPEDYGPSLGWTELVLDTLQIVELPGDHNSIMYAPQAKAVAAMIDRHFPVKPVIGFAA